MFAHCFLKVLQITNSLVFDLRMNPFVSVSKIHRNGVGKTACCEIGTGTFTPHDVIALDLKGVGAACKLVNYGHCVSRLVDQIMLYFNHAHFCITPDALTRVHDPTSHSMQLTSANYFIFQLKNHVFVCPC